MDIMESTAAAAEAAETAARNALLQCVALRTAIRLDESKLSLGFGGPSAFLAACSVEELATLLADNAVVSHARRADPEQVVPAALLDC